MAYNISAFAGAGTQFFDNDGNVLSGGLLYVYTAGTTTPATSWTSNSGAVANTNPIVLDSAGRTPNEIWLNSGVTYKFVLKTSTGVLIGTYDNIPAIDDPTVFNNLITVTGTNTLIGTSTPPYTAYVRGMTLSFVPVNTNTGAVTIDLDGLGAKNIYIGSSSPLSGGEIVAGRIVQLEYDGTRFQLYQSSIADGAITTSKIADGAVTTVKIADANVTAVKLASGAAVSNIGTGGITATQLASNSVTTVKITDANVTPAKLSQPLTLATVQFISSGTTIDFTSIPSWVKRITVAFWGTSTNGSSPVQIQIGAGGFGATSYTASAQQSSTITTSTTGVICTATGSASNNLNGLMVFTLVSFIAGNQYWAASGSIGQIDTGGVASCAARINVNSGPMDRLRITTVNGTDTFDAGSINILYE